MISLRLRSKAFGDQAVLGAFELQVAAGDRVAILGPSGVGKSTLLRILAGLDSQFDGDITRPERMAMVFQEPTLLPWRSVADNLRLATGASRNTVVQSLDDVGLADHLDKYPGQMSLGQQRRVALARALTARPELLLLDEPFASLDADTAIGMRGLVGELIRDRDIGVVLVTHDRSDAAAIDATPLRLSGIPATLGAV